MALLDEYKLLAMRADKRLQRLEKYMKREQYKNLGQFAYARAVRDIEVWSGKGHKRFLTKPPTNDKGEIDERALRAKINDIKSFLRADTSTVMPGKDTRGYSAKTYAKMATTFNKRYGANLTWQELAQFYESKTAEKISKSIIASKSVAIALGKFKELQKKDKSISRAQILRDLKSGKNVKLDQDETINQIMLKMVQSGVSPRTIFNKRKKRL